jgi:cysteine desulfurase
MAQMIYLDHNATTPILPEVLDAMMPYLTRRQYDETEYRCITRQLGDLKTKVPFQPATEKEGAIRCRPLSPDLRNRNKW